MKRITAYVTENGAIYQDFKDAKRMAENRYGIALCELCHRILKVDKYQAMQDFIDENLEAFLRLAELKRDINLETNEEE